MDAANEALPSYEDVHLDRAPSLTQVYSQMALAIDPTGLFIRPLSTEQIEVAPLYSLSSSLLNVSLGTSIQVKRLEPTCFGLSRRDEGVAVCAIGDRFIKPLNAHRCMLRNIVVSKSHGILITTKLRKTVWDFSTPVPLKKGETDKWEAGSDPVVLLGVGNGPATVLRRLLQLYDTKWVCYVDNPDGEAIAFEREGGEDSKGMPMLTVVKNLNGDMMDFLVSAWCVRLWGEAGKVACGKRRFSLSF
ncbi:hypothetical protein B7463_g7401, partial [Scytalidium lignicola]